MTGLNLHVFPEKLKHARETYRENHEIKYKTKKSLAKKLKLKETTYNSYEKGERMPPVKNIVKIANALHVSMDSLFGSEENLPELRSYITEILAPSEKLQDELEDVLRSKNLHIKYTREGEPIYDGPAEDLQSFVIDTLHYGYLCLSVYDCKKALAEGSKLVTTKLQRLLADEKKQEKSFMEDFFGRLRLEYIIAEVIQYPGDIGRMHEDDFFEDMRHFSRPKDVLYFYYLFHIDAAAEPEKADSLYDQLRKIIDEEENPEIPMEPLDFTNNLSPELQEVLKYTPNPPVPWLEHLIEKKQLLDRTKIERTAALNDLSVFRILQCVYTYDKCDYQRYDIRMHWLIDNHDIKIADIVNDELAAELEKEHEERVWDYILYPHDLGDLEPENWDPDEEEQ